MAPSLGGGGRVGFSFPGDDSCCGCEAIYTSSVVSSVVSPSTKLKEVLLLLTVTFEAS